MPIITNMKTPSIVSRSVARHRMTATMPVRLNEREIVLDEEHGSATAIGNDRARG
jgi:hypothetical protein